MFSKKYFSEWVGIKIEIINKRIKSPKDFSRFLVAFSKKIVEFWLNNLMKDKTKKRVITQKQKH